MVDLSRALEVAIQAAHLAGAILKAGFHERVKSVNAKKNQSDLVTETDINSEKAVFSHIRAAFPDHALIGEEGTTGGASELTDAPTWMCDPLDGTTNFVHSNPSVCVSIALVVGKEVVVGVVLNPIQDELFTAAKGQGAQLNGAPIRVSDASELRSSLLATEIGVTRDEETFKAVFARIAALARAMQSVRCCGSCALDLCAVASGRVDAFTEIGFGGCWDVAAGALIVQEAGGALSDPSGGPFGLMSRRVLVGTQLIVPQVAATSATNAPPMLRAGGPFGLMSRRVLAGTKLIVPQVAAIIAGCPTSAHEPQPPTL